MTVSPGRYVVHVKVTRTEGGPPPAGATVQASAVMDGVEVWHGSEFTNPKVAPLDALGRTTLTFTLPPKFRDIPGVGSGRGSVNVMVRDGGGASESAAKTIPVNSQNQPIVVHVYPEGGELVVAGGGERGGERPNGGSSSAGSDTIQSEEQVVPPCLLQRVYVEAYRPSGEPADFEADIVEERVSSARYVT